MAVTPPVDAARFKDEFDRDFQYGSGLDKVRDKDINRALTEANALFNAALWATDEELQSAYLYLSAHFLVMNLQVAGGLRKKGKSLGAKNRGGGVIQSKSVGQVSVNFTVPDFVTNDATLSQLLRTDYGMKYVQLLAPRLVGNVGLVTGTGLIREDRSSENL